MLASSRGATSSRYFSAVSPPEGYKINPSGFEMINEREKELKLISTQFLGPFFLQSIEFFSFWLLTVF